MRPDILGVIEDIDEAIGFVVEDTAGMTFDAFMGDRRLRQLVSRNLLTRPEFDIQEDVGSLERRMGGHKVLLYKHFAAYATLTVLD